MKTTDRTGRDYYEHFKDLADSMHKAAREVSDPVTIYGERTDEFTKVQKEIRDEIRELYRKLGDEFDALAEKVRLAP